MSAELQELVNELEWRKCRGPENATDEQLFEAFVHFCHTFWFIQHPERGAIKFDMFDAQLDTVRKWIENRFSVTLKARQIGFSTLVAAYMFWCAYFFGDRQIIALSRTLREAVKLLAKSKYGYKRLPPWMKARGPQPAGAVRDFTQEKMEFDNDSSITSMPSGNDPARGETVWLAVVDEMASLPNSEEAWASIEPIADVGGRIIALSTAKGEGNVFHELYSLAEAGINGYKAIFHPWWAREGRDDAWYELQCKKHPEWYVHQEYPSNPEEAFLMSGRLVFNRESIANIHPEEPEVGFLLESGPKTCKFERLADGSLRVWEHPQKGVAYVVGADVAEGKEHGDFSSAHVFAADTGKVVAHWHGRIDPDLYGSEILANLGYWYNTALVGIENNSVGIATILAIKNSRYPKLYKQRRESHMNPQETEIVGWRTTGQTKQEAIYALNGELRDGGVDLRCAYTMAELRTYKLDEHGRMSGSPHDDRVMSVSIANMMRRFAHSPEYQLDRTPPEMSMKWFEQFLPKKAKDRRPMSGGCRQDW